MRKMLLLAATGLLLDLEIKVAAADPLRDRDAPVQREMAGQRSPSVPAPAAEKSDAHATAGGSIFAPGFVAPYGYPLPPYADDGNLQPVHTGR